MKNEILNTKIIDNPIITINNYLTNISNNDLKKLLSEYIKEKREQKINNLLNEKF